MLLILIISPVGSLNVSPSVIACGAIVSPAAGAGDTNAAKESVGPGSRSALQRCLRVASGDLSLLRGLPRFLQALRLPAAGRAVKAVARNAGYRSASAFVATFSDTFGTTSGRYCGDSVVAPSV